MSDTDDARSHETYARRMAEHHGALAALEWEWAPAAKEYHRRVAKRWRGRLAGFTDEELDEALCSIPNQAQPCVVRDGETPEGV